MTDVNIENLFDVDRLPVGWNVFPFFLYFPLGLVLSILRLFIGLNAFVAACVLPKVSILRSCVLRTMCIVLGILIHEEQVEHKNRQAKIIISNHVSILDHLAIDLVLPCILPSVWNLPQFFNWSMGFKDLGMKQSRQIFIQNVKRHCEETECPVLAHPEGTTTNGHVGLLKFSTWPFSLNLPVYPVVIKITRPPVIRVATETLTSRWWSDLFWFLFTPVTVFTLRYLPVMYIHHNESEDEFTKRVQKAMSEALNISATNFTSGDKVEYIKKVLVVPARSIGRSQTTVSLPRASSDDSFELTRLAQQVKEVLPYVPLEVIKRDLVRTRNVDLTITNILEGLVPFVPEIQSVPSTSIPTSVSSTSSSDQESFRDASSRSQSGSAQHSRKSSEGSTTGFSTGASSFAKTAEDRMLSFQERKQRLIESARQRYMEKHNML